MKPLRILVVCESCWDTIPEASCFPPDEVGWGPRCGQWLCHDCWAEYENVGEDQDKAPLVYAKDALTDRTDQHRRLVAAAAKRRMGVK